MGRGLSPLQLWIVNRAAEKKAAVVEGGRDRFEDVLDYSEILVYYFEWPKRRAGWAWGPGATVEPSRFSQNFRKDWVGEAEYGRVMAALSRSVRRLEQRGLVEKAWNHFGGVRITELGKSLSVNTGSI